MVHLVSLKVVNSDQITEDNISSFVPRAEIHLDEIREEVQEIINRLRKDKDNEIVKDNQKWGAVSFKKSDIKASKDEINEAYNRIDNNLLKALKYAKENLIKFHKSQLRENWSIEIEKGVKAGQIYRPLESVGIYIPGGKAVYVSTVLMAATPAYIAGVKNIVICTPPQLDRGFAPEILVAANEFGIDKIYNVGGATAIAAMAYGTETIPKVQKIVGPGNRYVNAAKQLLSNIVSIDNPAGPSEILIIADNKANLNHIIIDFISQIEHDPDNVGIIVSYSSELIEKINNNLESFIERSERKEIIKTALNHSIIVKAKDIEDCIRISNIIAPEHLEILIENPQNVLEKINNAGAIFLGPYSPVPLGDYCAGTNHILPTGGYAKVYSGLSVNDFIKTIDVLECTKEGLIVLSDSASKIAEFEGFYAHKESLEERLKDKD
jgi:histidinol dehydrogenase